MIITQAVVKHDQQLLQ